MQAQVTVDFEDLPLTVPPAQDYSEGGVYYNGSDEEGSFNSGGIGFVNNYNTDWDVWDGWSYSTTTDTETSGFDNQYSAFTGGGAGGSDVYGVYYSSGSPSINLSSASRAPQSMMITNTTYAALAMRDGDAFAKQFDTDDDDFFKLTIEGFDSSGNTTGAIDFYLADYRFNEPEDAYIVDEWTFVDLTSLGTNVSQIGFSFDSSDVSEWGINTPTYFAMDNFSAIPEPSTYAFIFGVGVLGVVAFRRWFKSSK